MVNPTYLLDTNTWIYALKGRPPSLVARLGAVDPDSVVFCSVVKAELIFGAYRYGDPQKRLESLRTLFSRHRSLPFDDAAAEAYGQIRHILEKTGQGIGPMDLLIAAISVANGVVLVTHNTTEFERVADLELADWTV
jgi:tRNA(fMet)-specific endonuclease VapC